MCRTAPRRSRATTAARRDRASRATAAAARRRRAAGRDGDRPRRPAGEGRWRALFIGAGREAGIRPGDLVGAIANEAGISSRDLGAIQIADRFSLVEVPDAVADDVIDAMRGATLRGQRVTIRRDRDA